MAEETTYKYYAVGDTTPIRITLDQNGLKRGAETIDPCCGDLVIRPTLLSTVETHPDAREISRKDFEDMVEQVKKKPVTQACEKRLTI